MYNIPLKLKSVCKTYGSSRGINEIDLELEKGESFGFLGPNDADKIYQHRFYKLTKA